MFTIEMDKTLKELPFWLGPDKLEQSNYHVVRNFSILNNNYNTIPDIKAFFRVVKFF